ncbi:MAG: T9SS type A sorting domain-containing protein [Bacteroidia bacterium]
MKHTLLKFCIAFVAPVILAGSLHAQCPAATPTSSNSSVNCGGTTTLTATGSTGGYQWWDQSAGGNLLGSNAAYTTPALTTNTSYYVEGTSSTPTTMMPLPAHSSVFSGSVRGFYFTAPVNFVITGLKLPVEVPGNQSITVVKFSALPPLYATTTNAFTILYLTQNNPATGIIPVNIPIASGDIIGILGQGGTNGSYGTGNFATTIGGQPVTLARLGMQYPLTTTPPQELWTEAGGSISRVEMYYTTTCISPRVQVDVAVTPIPVVATTSTPGICTGSSAILDASGATNYNWMPGNLNGLSVVVTPAATETYTVTGTDPSGCTNTAMITVTVNTPPTVSANTTASTVCSGSPVTLSGGGATSYTWTGSVTDAVAFTPTATDTYTVTGTDANGCTGTAMTTVTVDALPTVVANSTASTVCDGSPVTLTGSGATSYTWTGSVTDAVAFTPTATDTYTVTGTDANGCMNTDMTTVTVNALPAVAANSTASAICDGSPVTLSGSGATSYTWTGSVTDNVAFTPLATDTYTVTGTDANGCANTAMTTVTVNPLPNVGANSSAAAVCMGSSVTLSGSGATSYTWTGSVTDNVAFTPAATNTYTVTGTDANGCMNTDMTTVTVNSLPTVTGTATSTTACLSDGAIALTGTPATGTWSGTGVTGTSFSPMAAGVGPETVTYTFTDGNGCTATATTTINVNACVTVEEQVWENGVNVYPNPNNGSFAIAVNANVGDLVIVISDMQGRVVYSSIENNVQTGFVKYISLEAQAAGLYFVQMTANGESRIEKIAVQK